jgi:hypothetical protein
MVTPEITTLRAPSNSIAGELSCEARAGAGAGVASAGCGAAPRLPAEFRNSPTRAMNCSNGLIFRSISLNVCGAAVNHFCAGSDIKLTSATMMPRMAAMISAAPTLRGTFLQCRASTGPESTRKINNAKATGTKATCAK